MDDLISLQQLFVNSLFRIPDYQRGYSWGLQQLEEFWSDLLNLLPGKDHYTGMISLREVKDEELISDKYNDEKWLVDKNNGITYKVYHVVDGQQRLTTFIILINEIIKYYQRKYPDKDTRDIIVSNVYLSKIIEDYLVIEKPGDSIIKTFKFGYEVDNPSYQFFKTKILEFNGVQNVDETFYTLNLQRAKDFFKDSIEDYAAQFGDDGIELLFNKVTQKLKFNIYHIDDDFNVFMAFETMNNRGKKLSYFELLKNRLIYLSTLFDCDEEDKIALRNNINDTWKEVYGYLGKNKDKPLRDDEFLQAHWIMYFGYSRSKDSSGKAINYVNFLLKKHFTQQNIKSAYTTITKYNESVFEDDEFNSFNDSIPEDAESIDNTDDVIIAENDELLTIKDINDYINSMKGLIKYWYLIHNADIANNNKIKTYIERIERLGYVYFKPLMATLLYKNRETEEVGDIFKLIERFIFLNFRLAGYFSTYRNSFFYNLSHELYLNDKTLDDVKNEVSKIGMLSDNKVCDMNTIMNNINRWFKNYRGYYSWNCIKYVLFEYENKLRQGKGASKIFANGPDDFFRADDKDKCSIEHIFPQTPTEEYWVTRFGEFAEEEKACLNGSLGNLLPLSSRINSSLQNHGFDVKKTRYSDDSHNAIEVSKEDEWTAASILNRGLDMLEFITDEWDFEIPNKYEKCRMLGLEFLAEDNYKNEEVKEIINEEKKKRNKRVVGYVSEKDKIRDAFWKQLIQKANERLGLFKGTNFDATFTDIWMITGSGVAHVMYVLTVKSNEIGVKLEFNSSNRDLNKKRYDIILNYKNEFDTAFNNELSWERQDENKRSQICWRLDKNIYEDDKDELLELMINKLEVFVQLMSNHLNEM